VEDLGESLREAIMEEDVKVGRHRCRPSSSGPLKVSVQGVLEGDTG